MKSENPNRSDFHTRRLPMSEEGDDCFRTILKECGRPSFEKGVDGYGGFLYYRCFERNPGLFFRVIFGDLSWMHRNVKNDKWIDK